MPHDIKLSPDEEYVTYRRRRNRNTRKPPFFICGLGGNNRNGESMDVINAILNMPTASGRLFNAMIKARDVETNVVLRVSLLQQPEIDEKYISNHMAAVIREGLVRRIQRGLFIINPDAVMPPNTKDAHTMWQSLETAQNNNEHGSHP